MIKGTIDASSVIKKFDKMLDRSKDSSALFAYILGDSGSRSKLSIKGNINNSFVTQTNADNGEGWRPLNPQYLEQKVKKAGAVSTLIYSARLYKALVEETGDTVHIATNKKLTYGTTLGYLKYHNSLNPRTRLPRRAPLGISKNQKEYFNNAFKVYLTQGIDSAKQVTK